MPGKFSRSINPLESFAMLNKDEGQMNNVGRPKRPIIAMLK